MPPKRKNKATKAPATTPQPKKQPARNSAAITRANPSTSQGGRTSKVSRLQPTVPLHMTTRGAARAASINTSSPGSSFAKSNSNSRRSSLNEVAQAGDDQFDVNDERPAKRRRVSTDSGSPPDSADHQIPDLEAQTPEEPEPMSRTTSNASKVSSKKRRASGDSSQSSKTVSARANGVPTRSDSNDSERQPRRKKRKSSKDEPAPADPPPELTDASTAPGSPEEQMPEIQNSQVLQNVLPTANVDAPAKAARRLPGRRRQPHPDVNVEADLRRQLNLKMDYRAIAKAQKLVLEELSNRTTNNLEKDAEFHKNCPEYPGLMRSLDDYRDRRLNQVHAERRLKLEQLERMRKAEEHIQKQQYINRFEDLRDDLLLQCYHRMLQIEREAKGRDGNATDDEQNIIEPARLDFPKYGDDDRLGNKFASRSRAYVETERMLDKEIVRQDFQRQQQAFIDENKDLDDSAQSIPEDFAQFSGPDRTEAIAHHNFTQLVDAASEIEKAPPLPEPAQVVPNEQADALFLMATLAADMPHEAVVKDEQQKQQSPPPQVMTPTPQNELNRAESPLEPFTSTSAAMSFETSKTSPAKLAPKQDAIDQADLQEKVNGVATSIEAQVNPIEPRKTETPKVSTHRIMDILNDDMEVPLSKVRDSQPHASSSQPPPLSSESRESQPLAQDQLRSTSPPRHEHAEQNPSSPQIDAHEQEANVQNQEQFDGDRVMQDAPKDIAPPQTSSEPPRDQYWTKKNLGEPQAFAFSKDSPLDRIREMLERKAHNEGRPPPDWPKLERERLDRDRLRASFSEYRQDGPQDGHNARRDSNDRAQMPAPPLSRAFSPQERPNTAGGDSRRPSIGGYNASSSNVPHSHEQSPRTTPAYPPPSRQDSQDQGSPHWDQARRPSGSQATSGQYGGSAAQSYPPDHNRSGPTPPTHQSPYPPPNTQQLPSISQSLPAKPPGPPPAAPINFRFAHYDPVPPRQTYPQPPQTKYAPTSQPPHSDRSGSHYPGAYPQGPHQPGPPYSGPRYPNPHNPHQAGLPPHTAPPQQPQYAGPYNGAPTYQGYVPPLGSFQAPPPPLPAPAPHMQQYPPLKIHQYGGQPILPANMAPLQSQQTPSHPQPPPHTQSPYSQSPVSQPMYSQAPSPHMQPPMNYPNPIQSSSAAGPAYSPSAPLPRNPQFEHVANMPRAGPPERPPEPQARPRRQYRSYHAPGTQFRTYQGPDNPGGRRRGS